MAIRHAFIDVGPLRSSPKFRQLWIGRTCSGFGSQMTLVAVLFQVWQHTHSTVWTGAVGIAQAAPLVVFGLLAGSLIDRSDRRRLYLIAITGSAACSVGLAVQGFAGGMAMPGLLGLLAVQSCFGACTAPVSRTFVPRLLPEPSVAAGLALQRISSQAAMLVGPAVGGLLIGSLGVGGCYAVDAVTFGLSFLGAFGLPPMPPEGAPSVSHGRAILDGLQFLTRNRAVRGALLTDLAATVLSWPVSLFPLVNAQRFHDDPRTLGLFLTAIAVGGVLASLLSGAFTRLPRPGLVMLAGSAGWGVALALFAVARNPCLGLGCLVLAGVADTVSVVSRSTIVLLHTPDSLRGRVSAAEQIVGQAGPDVGNLRAGVLASATSGTSALLSGGLLCVLAVVLIAATTPQLRRLPAAPEPQLATAI